MLRSQFSAIFANFGLKNWPFLNQSHDLTFLFLAFFGFKKRQFFRPILNENIFKIIYIGPRSVIYLPGAISSTKIDFAFVQI
jgi:hypothetical protein